MNRQASPASVNIRRAKACNTCRKKKIKCDGKRPMCSSCNAFSLNCVFQDQPKGPNRSSPAYIHALESRLISLEEQMHQRDPFHPRPDPDIETPSAEYPQRRAPSMAIDNQKDSAPQPPAEPNGGTRVQRSAEPQGGSGMLCSSPISDRMTCGVDPNNEKLRFFGISSSFSLTSLDSPSLEREFRGEGRRAFGYRSVNRWQAADWVPRPLRDPFEQRVSQNLPSKEVTMELVNEYFAQCNQTIPIFDRQKFMQLLERQFSWNPDDNPSWWAALNVVLAFSYRDRAERSQNGGDDWYHSFRHLKNALNVSTDLFMRVTDLLAVQAMLGLALFFQNTPNPQPLFMFCAAAVRLGQSIGLHKRDTFGFTPAEVETRRRVFWIAFILDADISYRTGRPPAQDMNDYDTPLPAEEATDGMGTVYIDGTRINCFYLLARFAQVQRQAYNDLYSAAASKASTNDLAQKVKNVSRDLIEWKNLIPENVRPRFQHLEYSSLTRDVLRLYLAFHCCNSNLFRVGLMTKQSLRNSETDPQKLAALDKDISSILDSALDSARTAIQMMGNIGSTDCCFLWGIIYFHAAACVPLCLQVLSDPLLPHADSDLNLIHQTTNFLSRVASREPNTYLDWILDLCLKLESAARLRKKQSITQPPRADRDGRTAIDSLGQSAGLNTDPVALHTPYLDPDGLGSFLTHNLSNFCPTAEWSMGPLWPSDFPWVFPSDNISAPASSRMGYGPFSGVFSETQESTQVMETPDSI